MSEDKTKLSGPDFTRGVELATTPNGAMLLGHAHGEPTLLIRRDRELFAVVAVCMHHGGPLGEGLLVDGSQMRRALPRCATHSRHQLEKAVIGLSG